MSYYEALVVAFLVTAVAVPIHIRLAIRGGKWGEDRHKPQRPRVAEMGGIAVFMGLLAGYALLHRSGAAQQVPVFLCSLLIVFFIGIADDVYALRQRTKLVLLTLSGVPFFFIEGLSLSVIGISIPGGVATWALIMVGMAAASNLTNILEGFNGESAGLGIIASLFLAAGGIAAGRDELAAYMLPMACSLAAFLLYNKYPAKVFPGDTGTLLIGGAIGAATILTDTTILGVIVLLPQIAEFLLKSLVRFGGVSYGPTKVGPDGILTPPPYRSMANSLTRTFRLTEPKLVALIWMIGVLCGCLSLVAALLLF